MTRAEAITAVRPGIVQIRFVAPPPDRRMDVLGTGFFVNAEAHVVTALHAIQAAENLRTKFSTGRLKVALAIENMTDTQGNTFRGGFVGVDVDVVARDSRHDLALLKLRENPFRGEVGGVMVLAEGSVPLRVAALRLNVARPNDGAPIAISGFPFGDPVLITNGGWVASSWSYDTEQVRAPDIADRYLADVFANPGNSGGPAYDVPDGAVIGVCIAIRLAPVHGNPDLGYGAGLAQIVPAKYVTMLLDKSGVAWTPR